MRNLLAFLAAAVLTFLGVGWYLNWYQIKSEPASQGHHNVNIDVNGVKIVEDVEKGVQTGEQKLEQVLQHEKNQPNAGPPLPPNQTGKQSPGK